MWKTKTDFTRYIYINKTHLLEMISLLLFALPKPGFFSVRREEREREKGDGRTGAERKRERERRAIAREREGDGASGFLSGRMLGLSPPVSGSKLGCHGGVAGGRWDGGDTSRGNSGGRHGDRVEDSRVAKR